MKTKFYLAALCLPMAFAACTNDELMEDTQALSGKTIDLVLTAEKPAIGVGSRMTIDADNNFVWEKDSDMIGAATFSSNNVLINYPFVAQNDAKTSTFNGKSSVMAGKYLFYYGYQEIVKASQELGLDVPTQTYDASKTESALEQIAGQMKMISPIVDLAKAGDEYINGISYEKAQSLNLAVPFVNLYSAVKINITPSNIAAGAQPKVTKVELAGKTGSEFKVKNLVAAVNKIDDVVLVPAADGTIDAEDIEEAKAALEEIIADGTVYQAKSGKNIEGDPVVLKVTGDCILENGKTTSLYLLVPKGTYTAGVNVTVETSEGTYTREDITDELTFDNDITQIGATPNFATDGSGDVLLPNEFNIASAEEWTEKIEFVKTHDYIGESITFELTKDVEITAVPDVKVMVKSAAGKSLILAGNMTLGTSNLTKFAGSDANLIIKAGSIVNLNTDLKAGSPAAQIFGNITNEGTLNLNTAELTNSLTNYGIVNVKSDIKFVNSVTNGRLENKSATPVVPAKIGSIVIESEKTMTMKTASENLNNVNGTITISTDAKLTTADVAAEILNQVDGTITNKGTLTKGGSGAAIKNDGTIDNYAVIGADINNEITAGGTVLVQKESTASTNDISGGIVDVKDLTAIASYTGSLTGKVTTLVNNSVEYASADENPAINNITLNGGEWKVMSDVTSAATTNKLIKTADIHATGAPSITLKSATLDFNNQDLAGVTQAITIFADGANCALANTGNTNLKAINGLGNTPDNKGGLILTVNKGAELDVEAGLIANDKKLANIASANIYGILNVKAGAKMYFNQVTVGTDGAIYVKGETEENAADQAVFGVGGTSTPKFENNGIVKAEKAADVDKKGEVSQPTAGDGTFGGGKTDITFE